MTQDELAVMDGGKCIFMLRGVRPFLSDKYDLTRHPAIRHTVDGGGPPYIHHRHQTPAFTGIPLFMAFSAEHRSEKENAA